MAALLRAAALVVVLAAGHHHQQVDAFIHHCSVVVQPQQHLGHTQHRHYNHHNAVKNRRSTALAMDTATDNDIAVAVGRISAQVSELTSLAAALRARNSQLAGTATPTATKTAPPPPPPAAQSVASSSSAYPPPLVAASLYPPTAEFVNDAQLNFLESRPYYDQTAIPVNIFRPQAPFPGTIVEVKHLVKPGAPGDVTHIKIKHEGKMPYWEGQSIGIIPPGTDSNGKPHKVRLYSIASTRYGDDGDGQTVSFCIRRAVFTDPETGKEDPAKKGVCSNFLTDSVPGTPVQLTGPVGKVMLLPEVTPGADIIMVGTGTGVAPYRGFIRRLFDEDTSAGRAFTGTAWLFLGVANRDALLYHDDFMSTIRRHPFNFRYDLALSREEKNKAGGKMYIQDKMEEHADEIFTRLSQGAHMYFCGLKGMMPGINAMLERVAQKKGLQWEDFLKGLKAKGQWHVEVY